MSLHNRIMELPTQDRHLEDWSNTRMAWLAGFDTGLHEAAEVAKEADKLMAEMAEALAEAMEWNWMDEIEPVPDRIEYQITDVLNKYKAMKESTK